MKLVVVGHTYITAISQSKYVAMKRVRPDLQLRLVVPHEVNHVFMRYRPEIHPGLEPQDVVVLPAVVNNSQMTRIMHPTRLAALLRTFGPDHIHIEEDPHSLTGVETVFLARQVCPRPRISFFIWDNLARVPRFPLSTLKAALTRYSLARCDLVVCGNTEGQRLLGEFKGYAGPSVVLPQVGLEPEDYAVPLPSELAKELGKTDGTPLIGFIGRLVPEKGILLLLEALSRLQALRWGLVIIGNGPMREVICTRWQGVLGERLRVLAPIPHTEVARYLRCLDIFVLPSYGIPTWKEQFGLTLAQAMMAGIACIGSSSGAIPEVMGGSGLIFPENDVGGLTSSLEMMIQSETERTELGKKARAFALRRYTNNVVAGAYLRGFEELAGACRNDSEYTPRG